MCKPASITLIVVASALALLVTPGAVQADHLESTEIFPEHIMYTPYLASPIETRFKLNTTSVNEINIPESSRDRWELKAGRTIGILRINKNLQVNVFGGFMASFDIDHSADNIGWDGLFGAQLIRALGDGQHLKLGYAHQSAHRGDEYIERTGRNRIDYTRQEVNLGISLHSALSLRTYAEGGWGTTLRTPGVQEPGRFQAGIEYGIPTGKHAPAEEDIWGPFLAADFEAMEERDWQIDSSIQAGAYVLKGLRLWRLGLEFRDGRSPYGEFFNRDETYVGVSFWNDFL